MTILLSALAILGSSLSAKVQHGEEIFVRTDGKVPVERLATAVRPMGMIESRQPGSSVFLIQLNPGVDDDKAKERLGKIAGVHPLTPDQEPLDLNSLRSLNRKIAHLSQDEADERAKGQGKKAKHEKDEVDYLKAYRYFVNQRAYPNDKMDWSAFARGQVHATKMRPTMLGWSGIGAKPATTQAWSFVGPTNLQVPYSQFYGLSPVNGRVNAVAYDPNNSQTIYAGSAQGGLWKSADGGTTWSWLSSSWTQLAINCIVIDPTDTDTIYVGRGDYHGELAGSYGLMKSTDGGATWTEIAEATMGQVGVDRILMDPTNSQVLVAGTGDSNSFGALYRSTNGGQTWTKLSVGGTNFEWPALASSVPVGSTVRFYAVAAGYANSTGAKTRVYKSDDHGVTWTLLTSPVIADGNFHYAYCVATSPTNSNNVYVLDSENQALYTSTNQGGSWTNQSANLPTGSDSGTTNYNFSQSFYDYHLECGNRLTGSTNADVLYLGEIDISESVNGGTTWTSLGGPTYDANNAITHNDQHCLAVSPTNPNQAIFSNDGGVYSLSYNSSNGSNTIVPLNQYLGVSMFYKIAFHPSNPNFMLGGTQDNASPLSTGDLSNWQNVGGGDGGGSAINQVNPAIQYTSSEELTIYQTIDAWVATENDISPNTLASENNNLPFVAALVLDPSNQSLMYTGTDYLYQWNQNTQQWNNRLGGQILVTDASNTSQPTVQAIAVAPTDSNRIYTGSSDGALWMTTNQGTNWTKLNPGTTTLPNQAITSISVSPYNENDILIGLSGTGQSTAHLVRCTNTLAATPLFINLTGAGASGLPDVSLNAIARDLDNPASTWWVAMDVGIFQSTDSGQTWTNAGSGAGLPNVIVDDLVAVPGTRYINAGTYGRGMWRLQLPSSPITPSLTNATLSVSSISPGGTSTGTVSLSSAAPSGGVTVNLSSSNTSLATVPGAVTVAEGATSATFTVTATATAASGSCSIGASYQGVTFSVPVTFAVPALSALTLTPTTLVGGNAATGAVSVSAAPTADTTVTLTSNSKDATPPTSVVIHAGTTSANFSISTVAVTATASATITAKLGTVSKTAVLAVKPVSLSGITLSQTLVLGGSSTVVTATVSISGAAVSTGDTVTLSSSNTKAATVPASVKIAGGASSATFTVTHLLVTTPETTTIKATFGGISQTVSLTVMPILVSGITVSPTSLVGGGAAVGTVTLNAQASSESKAISVKLSSSSKYAVVPATVAVPIGASSATFKVTTTAIPTTTTASLSATLASSKESAGLTILAPTVVSLSIAPSSVQGSSTTKVTGTVTLSSPAPVGGLVVSLKSSNTADATAPASVTIAAGKLSGTFTVAHKKVTAAAAVTITATLAGVGTTGTLTVTP